MQAWSATQGLKGKRRAWKARKIEAKTFRASGAPAASKCKQRQARNERFWHDGAAVGGGLPAKSDFPSSSSSRVRIQREGWIVPCSSSDRSTDDASMCC